jgi:hypothetical protein
VALALSLPEACVIPPQALCVREPEPEAKLPAMVLDMEL